MTGEEFYELLKPYLTDAETGEPLKEDIPEKDRVLFIDTTPNDGRKIKNLITLSFADIVDIEVGGMKQ